MPKLRVVIDTNVLYSSMARGTLLWLAHYDIFLPYWSEEIICELYHSLKQVSLDKRLYIIQTLNNAFPKAHIHPLPGMKNVHLPDKNDLHVVACAVEAKAQYIVTFNLKDFPPDEIDPITPISPDDFCILLFNISPELSVEALKAHWMSHKNPKISWEEYTARLNRARLHKLSRKLKKLDLSSASL
jgi:predicted nucleic acid-binding protein